ncbi:MAG TPA: DNA-3-methyladenine glycosylase [Solirubrobacteraceae bacterium]
MTPRDDPRPVTDRSAAPLPPGFFDRPVVDVARELVGCVLRHGDTSGVIVETEAYHESEPACHAYVGVTARTRVLFGPPGQSYVYFSYGMHALFNCVCEPEGVGAAVLIRALEPLDGIEHMRARRGLQAERDLCSGPGKLTQALGITLADNDRPLSGDAITVAAGAAPARLLTGPRIGITKAAELPWRFCAPSRFVSRPWPPQLASDLAPSRRRV